MIIINFKLLFFMLYQLMCLLVIIIMIMVIIIILIITSITIIIFKLNFVLADYCLKYNNDDYKLV